MIAHIEDAGPASLAGFDAVIDVRSPAEFAQDHAPAAINLPVLSDEERAQVGTIYVQDDPFRARRLGAALLGRNIAAHLEGPLAGKGGGWRPLVYCWRGGQRSHAFAAVLDQVGWRTTVLTGGYRTYRRGVVQALYEGEPPPRVVLLSGPTGAGKTELLAALAAQGVQTLDLEGLARHRGSLLGALPGAPQPSQKAFESALAAALATLDHERPVVVEAESSRIGDLTLPPTLWAAMREAPTIAVAAPDDARVRRLVGFYSDGATADLDAFAALLDRLPRHIGAAERARWREMIAARNGEALAAELMARHYDPAYARSEREATRARLGTVDTGDGSPEALEQAARAVKRLLP